MFQASFYEQNLKWAENIHRYEANQIFFGRNWYKCILFSLSSRYSLATNQRKDFIARLTLHQQFLR